MPKIAPATAERWFRIVVVLGVASNLLLSIGALLVPNLVLSLFGISPAYPDVWVRFSAVLLILLSFYYLPGAFEPRTHAINADLVIVSRAAGVLFFPAMVLVLDYSPLFLTFAVYDFIWGFPAAVFLSLSRRAPSTS